MMTKKEKEDYEQDYREAQKRMIAFVAKDIAERVHTFPLTSLEVLERMIENRLAAFLLGPRTTLHMPQSKEIRMDDQMKELEMQAAIDAMWLVLGHENYGCLVTHNQDRNIVIIDIAGEYKANTYMCSDMIELAELSNGYGGVDRVELLKAIHDVVENAVAEIFKFHVLLDLGAIHA